MVDLRPLSGLIRARADKLAYSLKHRFQQRWLARYLGGEIDLGSQFYRMKLGDGAVGYLLEIWDLTCNHYSGWRWLE